MRKAGGHSATMWLLLLRLFLQTNDLVSATTIAEDFEEDACFFHITDVLVNKEKYSLHYLDNLVLTLNRLDKAGSISKTTKSAIQELSIIAGHGVCTPGTQMSRGKRQTSAVIGFLIGIFGSWTVGPTILSSLFRSQAGTHTDFHKYFNMNNKRLEEINKRLTLIEAEQAAESDIIMGLSVVLADLEQWDHRDLLFLKTSLAFAEARYLSLNNSASHIDSIFPGKGVGSFLDLRDTSLKIPAHLYHMEVLGERGPSGRCEDSHISMTAWAAMPSAKCSPILASTRDYTVLRNTEGEGAYRIVGPLTDAVAVGPKKWVFASDSYITDIHHENLNITFIAHEGSLLMKADGKAELLAICGGEAWLHEMSAGSGIFGVPAGCSSYAGSPTATRRHPYKAAVKFRKRDGSILDSGMFLKTKQDSLLFVPLYPLEEHKEQKKDDEDNKETTFDDILTEDKSNTFWSTAAKAGGVVLLTGSGAMGALWLAGVVKFRTREVNRGIPQGVLRSQAHWWAEEMAANDAFYEDLNNEITHNSNEGETHRLAHRARMNMALEEIRSRRARTEREEEEEWRVEEEEEEGRVEEWEEESREEYYEAMC